MMKSRKSRRVRTVVVVGVALAAVAATGLVVANTSRAADSRWVTATATTGDVTQTYTATGSITRTNTEKVAFAVSGTVSSIKVGVGDKVTAGQVMATIDARVLKLALLQAETTVAQAELNLYNAQHPASASSARRTSSGGSKSASSRSGTGTGTPGTTSGLTTVTLDLTKLNQAVSAVNLAVVDEAKQCDAVMAWVNEEVAGPATTTTTSGPSPTSPSGASDPASAAPTVSASASSSPSPREPAAVADSATPSPSASATPYAAVPDPTEDQLKACASARAQLNTSNAALQTLMAAINAAANPSDDNSSPSGGSTSGGSSSGSSSATVSASAVDSAKASLLQANQKLQTAQDNLDAAELVAPISGVVGTITLSAGSSAGSGSVTIVGGGDAVVTIELPLKTRSSTKVGQAVQVTPAGSTKAMAATVTNISLVETSGTAGDSPTYTTTVGVPDPSELLASGAKASVTIPVTSVSGAVTVPASAVTPTGAGTASVVVLSPDARTTTTTAVKTGAVGGGRVQIVEGLSAGQVVVIADNTAAIPSNQLNRRTTTTSSSTSRSSSSTPASSATGQETTQPGSEPTR